MKRFFYAKSVEGFERPKPNTNVSKPPIEFYGRRSLTSTRGARSRSTLHGTCPRANSVRSRRQMTSGRANATSLKNPLGSLGAHRRRCTPPASETKWRPPLVLVGYVTLYLLANFEK